MMTGFDSLIMNAHLNDGEYLRACNVWQEALRAQTAGDPLEIVSEGADKLIDYACAIKKYTLAYHVMDIQNASLPYSDARYTQRIAQTGLTVMGRMLDPSWKKPALAVSIWYGLRTHYRHYADESAAQSMRSPQ